MKRTQVFTKLRRRRRGVASALLAGALAFLSAQSAWAIDVGAPITQNNGVIDFDETATLGNNITGTAAGLSATLAVGSGGTNLMTATDDNVMVGNGATWETKALTVCTGAGKALTYDTTGNAFDCNTITAGATPFVSFTSETKIASGSTTVYMGLGGRLSTTEANVLAPIDAATLKNLRCYTNAATGGTGIAVTLGVGACTGALTYTGSKPTVTLTTTTPQSDTFNTAAVTAEQCVALKLVPASTTTATFVNCTLAKTADS